MSLVAIPGIVIPALQNLTSTSSATLSLLGDKIGMVCQAPKAGTIRKVIFYINARTLSHDTVVSLQDVDTSTGFPDGVADQSVTVLAAAMVVGWVTADFGAGSGRAVAKGDLLAVVIDPSGGTPNWAIGWNNSTCGDGNQFPYRVLFTAASWGKAGNAPMIALEYDDGTYAYIPTSRLGKQGSVSINLNSASFDEVAQKFVMTSRVRVIGACVGFAANEDWSLILYNGTTALATLAVKKNVSQGSASNAVKSYIFATPVVLDPGISYYLAIRPDTTTNATITIFDVGSAAMLNQMSGHGATCLYAQRLNSGAWSETATRRLEASLLIDAIETGGPSRGRMVHA